MKLRTLKTFGISIIIGLLSFGSYAQEEKDSITELPDVEAQFPGGTQAMMKFFSENIEYPELSTILGDQGRVFVEFVIEKDGSLSNIKILRGVTKEIDSEAIRVIHKMPNWTPAIHNDEIVRARARMPINFILSSSDDGDKKGKKKGKGKRK